jgi:hypothetical protein
MQQIGFLLCFILFVVPAFHYKFYSGIHGIHSFQAMYFLSSFFNQFGPNAITFLVAAEVYPTPIRASAHGFSAACGKVGALVTALLGNYTTVPQRFFIVPWFGLLGMVVTALFLPDTTGLDLKEQERRWAYIRSGRDKEYHGIAVHPQHLSLWERFRGVGKAYDAELDYQQRINDMRLDWEAREAEKQTNENGLVDVAFDDDVYSTDVHNFFRSTSKSGNPVKARTAGDSDEISNEKTA